jgi:hypothetical protein
MGDWSASLTPIKFVDSTKAIIAAQLRKRSDEDNLSWHGGYKTGRVGGCICFARSRLHAHPEFAVGYGFQALTAHPARAGVIYAAAHAGLYESVNFGADWRKLTVPSAQGEHFWALAIHPRNPDVLLAGVGPVGVYKSVDAGNSWRRAGSPAPMAELTTNFGDSEPILRAGRERLDWSAMAAQQNRDRLGAAPA